MSKKRNRNESENLSDMVCACSKRLTDQRMTLLNETLDVLTPANNPVPILALSLIIFSYKVVLNVTTNRSELTRTRYLAFSRMQQKKFSLFVVSNTLRMSGERIILNPDVEEFFEFQISETDLALLKPRS